MNRSTFLSTTETLAASAPFAPRLLAADTPKVKTPSTAPAAAAPAANQPPALSPRFGDARDWWFQKRFGLFVHWGPLRHRGLA